jgi:mRNA-degrading endonuclease YafQ of YafQ-DinJ toxin-antitoxin module
MSSQLPTHKPTEAGATIVLVLTGILLLSLIASGLLSTQRSLSSSTQKVEQLDVIQDVGELCLKNVIRYLKSQAALPTSWISSALQGVYRSYSQASVKACTYQYLMSRAIKGTTIGGELTRGRAYVTQEATEKIYLVNARICNDSSCTGVISETNFYIGVQ